MTPSTSAADLCCARLPPGSLSQVAGVRTSMAVRARMVDGALWLYWPVDDPAVLHRVLAVDGAEVHERRGGLWYRHGQHLPVFDVPPDGDARSLIGLLTPAPVEPQSGATSALVPVRLQLVRDDRPRPATALICPLADLASWVDLTTRHQTAGLQAAWSPDGSVLIIGEHLPPIASGDRFWGHSVLIPLGFRPDPDVSEDVLKEALGLGEAIAVMTAEGVEMIDRGVFGPLSRAGVRLAATRSDEPEA
jgi:hypothetical protein